MSRRNDFLVGLTALLGLAALGVTLLLFGEFDLFDPPRYTLELRLDDARGLNPGSTITLNGVEVGRILTTVTDADPRAGVLLTLSIDERVRVPRDVEVAVQQDLLGESALALRAPPLPLERTAGDAAPALDGPDAFLAPGETFTRTAEGLVEQITGELDERLESFRRAAASIERLADTYTEVGERAKELLEDRDPLLVDAGAEPANLASTLARLDAAIAGARTWLDDPELRSAATAAAERLPQTLDRADAAFAQLETAGAEVSTTAVEARAELASAVRSLVDTAEGIDATLAEARSVIAAARAGEGAAGQFLINPDLYRNLDSAARRLERAVREVQLLVEKYRVEGVPVRF